MFPRQLRGENYDAFVAEFIEAAVDKYGKSVMLQVRESTPCTFDTPGILAHQANRSTTPARSVWLQSTESVVKYSLSQFSTARSVFAVLNQFVAPPVRGFREQQCLPAAGPLAGKGDAV